VTTFEGVAQLREVLFREYGESLPASSLVQVAGLFSSEINVEIEAVLAVSGA
jgi:2-iminobutanoate/2-iminopropanoate deaminase